MTWGVFFPAFVIIFFAALPGRTTFVMLLLGARGNPGLVFIGAALAFAAQSAISVALGQVLSFLSPRLIHLIAGLLFFYFAFTFWKESQKKETGGDALIRPLTVKSAFTLIFAAEWGDVSQLAIATLAAPSSERISVFIAAVLALWLIAGAAIGIGSHAGKFLNQTLLQRGAAVLFALTAVYLVSIGLFNI